MSFDEFERESIGGEGASGVSAVVADCLRRKSVCKREVRCEDACAAASALRSDDDLDEYNLRTETG